MRMSQEKKINYNNSKLVISGNCPDEGGLWIILVWMINSGLKLIIGLSESSQFGEKKSD